MNNKCHSRKRTHLSKVPRSYAWTIVFLGTRMMYHNDKTPRPIAVHLLYTKDIYHRDNNFSTCCVVSWSHSNNFTYCRHNVKCLGLLAILNPMVFTSKSTSYDRS